MQKTQASSEYSRRNRIGSLTIFFAKNLHRPVKLGELASCLLASSDFTFPSDFLERFSGETLNNFYRIRLRLEKGARLLRYFPNKA